MDPLSFLTSNFVMFSLGIMAIMSIFRTFIEYFIPLAKVSKVWNGLILITAPVIIGGLFGWLIKAYPYGVQGTATHIMFGAVAGMLSGIIFKVIKDLLGSRISQIYSSIAGQPTINQTTVISSQPVSQGLPIFPPSVQPGEPQAPLAQPIETMTPAPSVMPSDPQTPLTQ